MRAYLKSVFAVEGAPFLIRLSFYGNNAPCCQADQDFSKTSKTSAALAAWLQDCHSNNLPSPLNLNACFLFSTKTGQESYFQHDSPSATFFPSPYDLAAFPLPPSIFFALSRLRPSSWVKGL